MAVNPERPVTPIAPLPCGRDAAPAWDRAAAGLAPDEHERGCPHCAAVLADAGRLHPVTDRMAAQPIEPPPMVLARAMRAVRTEVLPRELLVLPSGYGPARLSSPAAAAVLRDAVDRTGGVRARSCRIEQGPGSDRAAAPCVVTLTVTARYGLDLGALTDRVRAQVLTAAERTLGLPVARVDIEVVDVFADGSP